MLWPHHLNRYVPPPSVPLVLVGVVVFAVSGIFGDPLYECLQDTDYSELLGIVDKGLPASKTPRHVAIIGGGIAGLTAAKFLEDAGHKVKSFRVRKGWFRHYCQHLFAEQILRVCRLCVLMHNKVTIIEASGRIGGRVETFRNRKEGWYAEMGAMRIPSFHKWVQDCLFWLSAGIVKWHWH